MATLAVYIPLCASLLAELFIFSISPIQLSYSFYFTCLIYSAPYTSLIAVQLLSSRICFNFLCISAFSYTLTRLILSLNFSCSAFFILSSYTWASALQICDYSLLIASLITDSYAFENSLSCLAYSFSLADYISAK